MFLSLFLFSYCLSVGRSVCLPLSLSQGQIERLGFCLKSLSLSIKDQSLSLSLSICLSLSLCLCLSVSLSVSVSVSLGLCLCLSQSHCLCFSFSLSLLLFISPHSVSPPSHSLSLWVPHLLSLLFSLSVSVHLSVSRSLPACLPVSLPVSLCVSLSLCVFLCVCLSVCLCLSLCLSFCAYFSSLSLPATKSCHWPVFSEMYQCLSASLLLLLMYLCICHISLWMSWLLIVPWQQQTCESAFVLIS